MTAYKLDEWVVYPESNELIKDGQSIKLESRVMEVLVYFCKNPERVISRDELIEAVWGRIALSANSLNVAIGSMRHALGEDAKAPKYLETLPKMGYRLIVKTILIEDNAKKGTLSQHLGKIAAVVGIFILGFFTFQILQIQTPVTSDKFEIALAGIENTTGKKENDLFAQALGDLFIAELAQHKDIRVRKIISGDTVSYSDDQLILTTLTGRLMSNADNLHLSLYLTNQKTSEVLWARSEPVNKEFYLPTARKTAESLFSTLNLAVLFHNNPSTNNVASMYQRAYDLAAIRSDVTRKAAFNQVKEVIRLNPEYGPAHALLARLYYQEDKDFWGTEEPAEFLAIEEIAKAKQYGADPAELLILDANASLTWEETRKINKQAVDLGSNKAWVYRSSIFVEMFFGGFNEALARNTKAIELSIDPSSALSERIWPLYFLGHYDEAATLYKFIKDRGILPVYYGPQSSILRGDQTKGFEDWVNFIRNHDVDIPDASEAINWVQNGEIAKAYEWLDSQSGEYRDKESYPLTRASWHIAAGNPDLAMETLQRGVSNLGDLSNHWVWNLSQFDPMFASVRDDPRWADIYQKVSITVQAKN